MAKLFFLLLSAFLKLLLFPLSLFCSFFFFTIQFKLAYSHPAVVLKTNTSFQRLYDTVYLPLNYRLCLAICKLI